MLQKTNKVTVTSVLNLSLMEHPGEFYRATISKSSANVGRVCRATSATCYCTRGSHHHMADGSNSHCCPKAVFKKLENSPFIVRIIRQSYKGNGMDGGLSHCHYDYIS